MSRPPIRIWITTSFAIRHGCHCRHRANRLTGIGVAILLLIFSGIAGTSRSLAEGINWDFQGSLGKGKHQRYVPPLSNPLFNETPYITTEARPIVFRNKIPTSFLTNGGDIDLVALELRFALTERFGLIASKDGYAEADFDSVLPDERGFANISIGFKYAIVSDPVAQEIITVGVEYEPPSGSLKTAGLSLQGRGGGFVDVFAAGAKAWDKLGIEWNVGINQALDTDNDSSMLHYSLHADYEVFPGLFPLIELNGFSNIDNGERTAGDFEGVDILNFGSTNSGTVLTGAVGARYRFNDHVQAGLGYERSLSGRKDILDWRVYADLVISF